MKNLIVRINKSHEEIYAQKSDEFCNQNLLKAQYTRTYYNGSSERRCYYFHTIFPFNDRNISLSFYCDSITIRLSKKDVENSYTIVTLPVDDIFDDEISLVLKYGRSLVEDLEI